MLLPKSLKYGDTIGIYSPSSPVTYTSPKRFERAKSYLQQKGFHILEGSLTGRYDFYRSGSIQERAEELNVLIRNPNVSCIMSTIGGMNSNSILPYIDYDAFLKNPKIMIGYSDATALLLEFTPKQESLHFIIQLSSLPLANLNLLLIVHTNIFLKLYYMIILFLII